MNKSQNGLPYATPPKTGNVTAPYSSIQLAVPLITELNMYRTRSITQKRSDSIFSSGA